MTKYDYISSTVISLTFSFRDQIRSLNNPHHSVLLSTALSRHVWCPCLDIQIIFRLPNRLDTFRVLVWTPIFRLPNCQHTTVHQCHVTCHVLSHEITFFSFRFLLHLSPKPSSYSRLCLFRLFFLKIFFSLPISGLTGISVSERSGSDVMATSSLSGS